MKITSWNVEGRLSRFAPPKERGSPEGIVDAIKILDSDIVFLPEAFNGAKNIHPEAQRALGRLGYSSIVAAYEEPDDREHQAVADPHLMLLSRAEVLRYETARLGDMRAMLLVDIIDSTTKQPLRIAGVHLDDRNEANRLRQVDDLVAIINASALPVVAMGDFNAMHESSLSARFFRSVPMVMMAEKFPHDRLKDILLRLSQMALGDTMRRIETQTNLVDADPKRRPTTTPKMRGQEWMPSIPMAQIDHIFVSPGINIQDFAVARDGGSDHRAISATINVRG